MFSLYNNNNNNNNNNIITIIITSIITKIKMNILIAQIPCEYDQMRVTNVSTKGLEFRTWLAQSVNDKRVKVTY